VGVLSVSLRVRLECVRLLAEGALQGKGLGQVLVIDSFPSFGNCEAMTMHTTNYQSTLILPSPDSTATSAQIPKKVDSVAGLQHAIIGAAPYEMTSDDVVFEVFARRTQVSDGDRAAARAAFFSKGQPCLRASPLVKSHGYAVHADEKSRVALIAMESADFARLVADESITKRPGLRTSRG
jgi:Family of unknown function (DUF6157)